MFPAYPHISLAKTPCCKPDPRESKEHLIITNFLRPPPVDPSELPAPAVRAQGKEGKKALAAQQPLLITCTPRFPAQPASKALLWLSPLLLFTATHQMGTSKEKQKINSAFLMEQYKQSAPEGPSLFSRLPLQGNLQFSHGYYRAERSVTCAPHHGFSLGSS